MTVAVEQTEEQFPAKYVAELTAERDRLIQRIADAEARIAAVDTEDLDRLRADNLALERQLVARRYGISDLADRLTGDTRESIEADARALAARVGWRDGD